MARMNWMGLLASVTALFAVSAFVLSQDPTKAIDQKPLEVVKQSIISINLNERAELLVLANKPIKDIKAIEKHFANELATQKAIVGGDVDNVVVIIRAPAATRYGDVIRVMELCIKTGATKIQLRIRKPEQDEK